MLTLTGDVNLDEEVLNKAGGAKLVLIKQSLRMVHKSAGPCAPIQIGQRFHWIGIIGMASHQSIQQDLEWTALVVGWLDQRHIHVFIIPPHLKFLLKCCEDGKHFDGLYNRILAYKVTLAVEEYLARWSRLLSRMTEEN
jgi:hypothetical protein